jgi:hypothetical protein
MSVLETPRILFRGQIDWDPIVTNNYSDFYNEMDSETVYPKKVVDRVAAFRARAIEAVAYPKINWNPHGTHRSTFFEASISGADLGKGTVDDAFVGSPANFRGMLVDLEPYGAYSSQLFFDAMSFGIEGGWRIAAPRSSRFHARYINFGRYKGTDVFRAGRGSVVWQSCFAKDAGLVIDAFDSDALQALRKSLEDDDVLGLTVQWNAYRTIYFNDPTFTGTAAEVEQPAELIRKLTGGGFQPNPARSLLVGAIGLWRRGEPEHEPCDRTLIVVGNGPVASAHARVADTSITLDLSNSISETDAAMTKMKLGDLTVVAVPESGEPVTIAKIAEAAYDCDAYLSTAGIVTCTITADHATLARTSDLQLRNADGVLLTEAPVRAIPLTPNLYLDEGDTGEGVFQLYDRGVPAGAGIEVMMSAMSSDGSEAVLTFLVTSEDDGTIRFPILASLGSIAAYVASPGPDFDLPRGGINTLNQTYMYVRILAADDATAQLPPTWENVYKNVLANWKAMAPCMDNWLDLANEAQVRSFGPMIKKLTDPAAFENFRYMPVTRDLTAGARTLLYNFLDAKPQLLTMMKTAAPVAEVLPPPVDYAELSRKQRS